MTSRELARLLGTSKALAWALDAGLLEALADAPRTDETLARELGCDLRALGLLLDVTEAAGLTATRDDGARELGPEVCEAARALPGGLARHALVFRALGGFAADGRALLSPGDASSRDHVYPAVVESLGVRHRPLAEALAARLGPARTILDVGAGSGVWSLAMAARDPSCRVTGVDGPRTAQVFLAETARRGLSARADVITGDYHAVDLPGGFDRVVLANVLHLETSAGAASLVARSARALAPEGELVIVDVDRDNGDALELAVYALHLALRVAGSAVYPREDLARWAAEAGRACHVWHELAPGIAALVAR